MHGFFLLHVSHTHGKVSFSRSRWFILPYILIFNFDSWINYHLGLQKQSADARAFSFIKILNLMQDMSYPPQMLFVENVVGFEVGTNFIWTLVFCFNASRQWISLICLWQVSDTHDQLLEVLSGLNFNTQEFILSPLQFGVPYSRPRYFCLVRAFEYLNMSGLAYHHGILAVFIFILFAHHFLIEYYLRDVQGIYSLLGLLKYGTFPIVFK